MRGGFRRLINPATLVKDVDLDGTRDDRERLHAEVRARQHITWLMSISAPGGDEVQVTPYETHVLAEQEPASVVELYELAMEQAGVPA
jgi:hypothetical protein